LSGEKSSESRFCCFTSGNKAPGTQQIKGWVWPKAGLDVMKKRKISYSCRESNTVRPSHSLIVRHTEPSRFQRRTSVSFLNKVSALGVLKIAVKGTGQLQRTLRGIWDHNLMSHVIMLVNDGLVACVTIQCFLKQPDWNSYFRVLYKMKIDWITKEITETNISQLSGNRIGSFIRDHASLKSTHWHISLL
jgi:hypothetical protein